MSISYVCLCFFLSLRGLSLLVVVDVKEIGVKQRLDDSGDNAHRLEGALEGGFSKIAEDPVWDVECPIESQSEQIVGSDGVCLSGSLQHE